MICISTWYFLKLASPSAAAARRPVCSRFPLDNLHRSFNCFISQNTSDIQSFWCFIPDINKLLLGGEAAWGSSTSHWAFWQPQAVLLLSLYLNFWLSSASSTMCWLWCFCDPFETWISCKLNKGIALKTSGWEGRWEEEIRKLSLGRSTPGTVPSVSWFLWNQALKLCSQSLWTSWRSSLDTASSIFPHAATSTCVMNWIRKVVWLRSNPTGKVVLLGVGKHRKAGMRSTALLPVMKLLLQLI